MPSREFFTVFFIFVHCGAMSVAARCDELRSALRWPMHRSAFSAGKWCGAVGCAERPSALPPPGLLWGLSFDSIDPLSSLACALGCICSKSWVQVGAALRSGS